MPEQLHAHLLGVIIGLTVINFAQAFVCWWYAHRLSKRYAEVDAVMVDMAHQRSLALSAHEHAMAYGASGAKP